MELETHERADRIWGYLATGNYFDVLGVQPAMGHFFKQSDDLHPEIAPTRCSVITLGSRDSEPIPRSLARRFALIGIPIRC